MHLLQLFVTQVPSFIVQAASFGGTGVHVFIFCSGFGLYLSYLKRPSNYWTFIKSRFGKIYFPYIFVVLVSFLIPTLYTGKDKLIALLSHVFLFKMFFEAYENSFGGHLWFMSTIFQFYLLFVPICFLKEKMRAAFLPGMLIVSILYWILLLLLDKQDLRIWNSSFFQYLWEFCLGMVVAEKMAKREELQLSKKMLLGVAILGSAVQAVFALQGRTFRMLNDIPALFGYGSLALLIYSLRYFNKPVLFVSGFSFQWYLVHILVFTLVFQCFIPSTLNGQLFCGSISLISSIVVAWGYAKAIEFVRRIRKD